MSTCPDGHESASDDYCDICGTPMDAPSSGAAQPTASAASSEPAAQRIACPNCQTDNVANALFCEACGYDFTTGTMPRPWVSPFAAMSQPAPSPETNEAGTDDAGADEAADEAGTDEAEGDEAETYGADGAEIDEPESDIPTTDTPVSDGPEEPQPDEPVVSEPVEPEAADVPEQPQPDAVAEERADDDQADEGEAEGADEDEADDPGLQWVAELWVDPDWYRQQEPPDPMPSPGLPTIVPLTKKSNLVGRPSRSRNIHPDVDCDSDPGASRRQAQLTTDGRRWWIEDLDSANGTYVAGAFSGLPEDPIPVGQRHELDPDDRIYLGAWTRMVIRQAAEDELETFG